MIMEISSTIEVNEFLTKSVKTQLILTSEYVADLWRFMEEEREREEQLENSTFILPDYSDEYETWDRLKMGEPLDSSTEKIDESKESDVGIEEDENKSSLSAKEITQFLQVQLKVMAFVKSHWLKPADHIAKGDIDTQLINTFMTRYVWEGGCSLFL